jgi:hypothetical protein
MRIASDHCYEDVVSFEIFKENFYPNQRIGLMSRYLQEVYQMSENDALRQIELYVKERYWYYILTL